MTYLHPFQENQEVECSKQKEVVAEVQSLISQIPSCHRMWQTFLTTQTKLSIPSMLSHMALQTWEGAMSMMDKNTSIRVLWASVNRRMLVVRRQQKFGKFFQRSFALSSSIHFAATAEGVASVKLAKIRVVTVVSASQVNQNKHRRGRWMINQSPSQMMRRMIRWYQHHHCQLRMTP